MFSPEDHPLKGWLSTEETFEVDFKATTETLAKALNVSQVRLDGTLESLEAISLAVDQLKSDGMDLDCFVLLLSYFGEVIRRAVNGSWKLKHNQDADVSEPWILYVHPSGATCSVPPHFALCQELRKPAKCSLKVAAEKVIENFSQAFLPRPRIGRLKYRYSDDSLVVLQPDALLQSELQIEQLITSDVHAIVDRWLIESIHYFSRFAFFADYQDSLTESLSEASSVIKQDFEGRFISGQSVDSFYLEFVDVQSAAMAPISDPVSKTKFLAAYLLRLDRNRVWSNREIPDVVPREGPQIEILKGLSRISRNLLTVEPQSDRLEVGENVFQLKVGDSSYSLSLSSDDELILSTLASLNRLFKLESLPYQFYFYDECLPRESIVIVFSEEEKQRLRQDKMFYV